MKDKFYQWVLFFLVFIFGLVCSTAYLSDASGFEYVIESPVIGDHLLVVRPRYIEYTVTNDGKSTELLWDDDDFTFELWEHHTQVFLFEREIK